MTKKHNNPWTRRRGGVVVIEPRAIVCGGNVDVCRRHRHRFRPTSVYCLVCIFACVRQHVRDRGKKNEKKNQKNFSYLCPCAYDR